MTFFTGIYWTAGSEGVSGLALVSDNEWGDAPSFRSYEMVEDRWLSVEEIALYLGVKRDTVYKWIGRKQMPAHKIGRLWKFRKEEVDEWVRCDGGRGRGDGLQ